VPLSLDPQPDFRVIIIAVLLALLSGVIFGLAPALQTTRWDLTQGLRERAIAAGGGIHRWNLRNLLVIAQIAVSLLLLIGSALFLKSFHSAQRIDPGFRTENLAIVSIDPALTGYDQSAAARSPALLSNRCGVILRCAAPISASPSRSGLAVKAAPLWRKAAMKTPRAIARLPTSAPSLRVTLKPCVFRFCGDAISPNKTPAKTLSKSQ